MAITAGPAPARYFVMLLDMLATQGVDTDELLAMAQIDSQDFHERHDARLNLEQANALIAAMRQVTGRSDLGFELGRLARINTHDILGYGLISCRNFDQVLQMGGRYYHLVNGVCTMRYQRRSKVGEVVFSPIVAMPLESLRFFLEAIAVSLQNHVHMLLGPDTEGYDFRMSMPAPPHEARYFGLAPARFEFDPMAVPGIHARFPGELLDRPLPMSAPHVVRQVEERCGPRVRPPGPGERWGEFVIMMLREAQGQQLTLDALARRMNVSPRTIDRSLKRENLQFRDLAQKIRMETACRLLAGDEATVHEVAERLGFSDAANFTRAFRRLTGLTPSAYREEALARNQPL